MENEVPDEDLSYMVELGSLTAIDAMRAYAACTKDVLKK